MREPGGGSTRMLGPLSSGSRPKSHRTHNSDYCRRGNDGQTILYVAIVGEFFG